MEVIETQVNEFKQKEEVMTPVEEKATQEIHQIGRRP